MWECQHHLQSVLADAYIRHENLPASTEIIILFLLSFPVLHVRCENDKDFEDHSTNTQSGREEQIELSLKIETVAAVQNLYIEVLINKNTRETTIRPLKTISVFVDRFSHPVLNLLVANE